MNFSILPLLFFLTHSVVVAQTTDNGMLSQNMAFPFIIYKCSHSPNSHVNLPPKFLIVSEYNNASRTTQIQNLHNRFKIVPQQDPLPCVDNILKISINISAERDETNIFTNNGHLQIHNGTTTTVVPPENFCIYEVTAEKMEIHACPKDYCMKGHCRQKCCPNGSVLVKNTNGNIECLNVPGNASVPETLLIFKTLEETNSHFLNENCRDLEIHILENYSFENQNFDQILEEVSEGNVSHCIDLFQHENSAGNASWKLARVSCKNDVELKLESIIKTKSSNFLYKCSADTHLDFLRIPNFLRMRFPKEMMGYYKTSSNVTSLFEFNLVEREPNCSGDTFVVTVSMQNNMPIVDNKKIQLNFTPDGYVAYMATFMTDNGDEKTDEIYFSRENFCISRVTHDSISLQLCKSKCFHSERENGRNVCIPKCCHFGAVMQDSSEGIECDYAFDKAWIPEFYKNILTDETANIYPQFRFHDDGQISNWNCTHGQNDTTVDLAHIKSDYRILSDGRIFTRKPGNNYSHLSWEEVFTGSDPTEFCIDAYWDTSKPFNPQTSDVYVHRCKINRITYNKTKALEDKLQKLLVSSKILLFLVYLPCALIYLLILVVYISLWDKQTVQGWTIMGFATSQLFVYIFLLVLLGTTVFGDFAFALLKSKFLCVFTGMMHYFFLVSTFTWTLLITFDLWAQLNYKGKRRFLSYACFAIGVPTLAVVIASVLEFSFLNNGGIILPGFRKTCLISENLPFTLYVVTINSSLFTANLIFGFLTFKTLWNAKQNMKNLENKSKSTSSTFENKAALAGKLMLLMGFVLVFEIIYNYTGLHQLSIWFNVLESYRLFHAIGLFWIFVGSGKTKKQLRQAYPWLPFWSDLDTNENTRSGLDGTTTVDVASTVL